jgi:hypothetical protein
MTGKPEVNSLSGVAVEKGTREVISANFVLFLERRINNLRAVFSA